MLVERERAVDDKNPVLLTKGRKRSFLYLRIRKGGVSCGDQRERRFLERVVGR